LDIYIIIVDDCRGVSRVYEAPEIARVASPCYFRLEPGTSEGDIYKPWTFEPYHQEFVRQKVKMLSIIEELLEHRAPKVDDV